VEVLTHGRVDTGRQAVVVEAVAVLDGEDVLVELTQHRHVLIARLQEAHLSPPTTRAAVSASLSIERGCSRVFVLCVCVCVCAAAASPAPMNCPRAAHTPPFRLTAASLAARVNRHHDHPRGGSKLQMEGTEDALCAPLVTRGVSDAVLSARSLTSRWPAPASTLH
jgi:hypothetical protein